MDTILVEISERWFSIPLPLPSMVVCFLFHLYFFLNREWYFLLLLSEHHIKIQKTVCTLRKTKFSTLSSSYNVISKSQTIIRFHYVEIDTYLVVPWPTSESAGWDCPLFSFGKLTVVLILLCKVLLHLLIYLYTHACMWAPNCCSEDNLLEQVLFLHHVSSDEFISGFGLK